MAYALLTGPMVIIAPILYSFILSFTDWGHHSDLGDVLRSVRRAAPAIGGACFHNLPDRL